MSLRFSALPIFFFSALQLVAQPGRTTLLSQSLKTLRLAVDGDAERFPVIKLDGSEELEVSFDDLTHEYRRYTYRIEHCTYDGEPTTELFESDYVSALADEEVIDDYEPSLNTTVLYTHYSLTIPNTHVRPLLSGNYRLTISAEDENGDNKPVLQTYFGVVDTKAGLRPTCTTNTEIDWNDAHQQIELRIDCAGLSLRDAEEELKTIVLQNRRYDNAVIATPPTAQNVNTLIWEHDPHLIFKAGNEYRKFEFLSTRYPGMHGDNMRWFTPYYHYALQTDSRRKSYLYDEDRDGLSLVRWESSGDPDTEADYAYVHFSLASLPDMGHTYYVNGRWATTGFSPEYEMTYNAQSECYEANILLKAGYYNYMYLATDNASSVWPAMGKTEPAEGDFYQTENEYTFLAYYRPTGARYWQLVGCATPIYRAQR